MAGPGYIQITPNLLAKTAVQNVLLALWKLSSNRWAITVSWWVSIDNYALQLVKVMKPMGWGKCPRSSPELMTLRRHSMIMLAPVTSDSKFTNVKELPAAEYECVADDAVISISSDDAEAVSTKVPVKAQITCPSNTTVQQPRTWVNCGLDVMNKLIDALDPAHQCACDEDCA
jgi:hypothetical protein